MNEIIRQRLEMLREVMRQEKIDAFIFPSTDPHNGEYVPEHWEGRKWVSGFDGSAGTAVVTMERAALWTDSRYFIAAEEQLRDTEFVLMKERVEGTPSIAKWLGVNLAHVSGGAVVGLDGYVNSVGEVEQLAEDLRRQGGITVRTNFDPLEKIWKDRPAIPDGKVEIHPAEYSGEGADSKLRRIRKALSERGINGMLVSALDDIAWVLNMRGADVHCNPVFVSYLLIDEDDTILYINKVKVSAEAGAYLAKLGVRVEDYGMVAEGLKRYHGYNILLDPASTSYAVYNSAKCKVVREQSPVPYMKSVKNAEEIGGFRSAMLKDGVAMVKFLKWLQPAVEAGGETELTVDRKLTALRAEQPLFKDVSFDTIAAYQEHGAIVHYEATPETDVKLKPEGFLLLDSGAQYLDGTTDITRTIPLGPVTEEQRHVYTLVLKGHIQLELCKFPNMASGTQLDILARQAMWREGMNFMHGTGHGVGSYLNVHEGPHQIRMEWKPAPLRAGMTVTDEPGLYLAGKFGVRIENTLLIKDYMETDFGKFLQFESLTLCPIDLSCADLTMLTAEEKQWLNDYHKMVYEKLSPLLSDEEKEWLKTNTARI